MSCNIMATMCVSSKSFLSSNSNHAQTRNISLPTPSFSPPPEVLQRYILQSKKQVSPDTCLLKFSIPSISSNRTTLGLDDSLPTCIKVTMPKGTTHYKNKRDENTDSLVNITVVTSRDISKSYSPISHPSKKYGFDLLVKEYPYREGGGVAAFLCSLSPKNCKAHIEENYSNDNKTSQQSSSSILASLKSPRIIHGSPQIYNRWTHVGLIAGGTGIAPLFQIATMLLKDMEEDRDKSSRPDIVKTKDVSLLFINRKKEDILLKQEIDKMVEIYGQYRFRVTYSLTGEDFDDSIDENDDYYFERGRGSLEMLRKALPPPSNHNGNGGGTMIFVCGTDEFVNFWSGPVIRGPPKADGSKGPKIQGPLLGLLKNAGYDETNVFKY